jgi:2-dehydropantoate 2-reductase
MGPNVVVVGGGAMGGLWAGRLAQSGRSVVVVDPAPQIVAAIQERGLHIREGDDTFTSRPIAVTDSIGLPPADLVFVFVKSQHTEAAAASAARLIGPDTIVVSLQNGWGNADVLARTINSKRLLVGVTYHSATLSEPGVIHHTGSGPTFLGPFREKDLSAALDVSALLGRAGIEVTVTADVRTEIWRKLILNAATLPTAALTGLTAGQLGVPGSLLELVDALAREAVRVAVAGGLTIDAEERIQRIHEVLAGAGAGRPSMLQDVLGRRKTRGRGHQRGRRAIGRGTRRRCTPEPRDGRVDQRPRTGLDRLTWK